MPKLIDRLKQLFFFKIMLVYTRYFTGFALVFSSFSKIQGERFTKIPVSDPAGYFFEAMYNTGPYWNFLGWSELLAGVLLMTQRFATVGAGIALAIILNAFMIAYSINFPGGNAINILMLLGIFYLLLWDYKKWMILFRGDHKIKLDLTNEPKDKFIHDLMWKIIGIIFGLLCAFPWIFSFDHLAVWALTTVGVGITAFCIMITKKYILKSYRSF